MPIVEIGAGELIDRITILEIKSERISDPRLRNDVLVQLHDLCAVRDASVAESHKLDRLASDLRRANEKLWEAEDAIRKCEVERSFDETFVGIARSIYTLNDLRTALKQEIDALAGSKITDIKQYGK
jgi:Family of unknown function (DUF6165)